MRKNRKKAEAYRFNGAPFLNTQSIHSVMIAELESRIAECEAKLSDPNDSDDKNWTTIWRNRYEKELAKKRKGLALKARERKGSYRSKPTAIEPDSL